MTTQKTSYLSKIKTKRFLMLFVVVLLFFSERATAQNSIQWISFEQLEDSLSIKPKKVFITFYADWCAYCKKMERVAFRDPKVISRLNEAYYAIKMNAEATDTIRFDGKTFTNKQLGKQRNPTHEIPLLLASRKNYPFSLPAMVLLNEKFEVVGRHFEYLSPKQLNDILAD
ncbi:MAG: thioredoxin fold domain-containing protein [Bacteroidota bacterium]